jgi:signal transduction histidine kinase
MMPILKMHRLLQRQLKRHISHPDALPQEWKNLLQSVNEAYHQFDDDRAMLERSLELSSEELLQANTQLQALLNTVAAQVAEQTAELARTNAELKQTLADLQKAQLQIVQSEKMASLGNLVAGIAHEINNPIGFLNGSVNNVKDYVQDLLGYLELYQHHHPQVAEPVQDRAEDIDLEFLCEDLPILLDSMQSATDRIKTITNSLRNFSRADAEHPVSTDLHEGIDSTLLILKYRLNANERRPAIQVIQEYGELPPIKCFSGQLNQVFMNILANAIDLFDEMAQTRSFAELKAHPQKIIIRTETSKGQIEISIRDNGAGMTEEVKSKVFDHLFTTKGVGKGTGLGLAIARQIVEDKHGGSIAVNSQLGRGTEFVIALPI